MTISGKEEPVAFLSTARYIADHHFFDGGAWRAATSTKVPTTGRSNRAAAWVVRYAVSSFSQHNRYEACEICIIFTEER
jgi:hypothetical protein